MASTVLERFYENNEMVDNPPIDCQLKVGDIVRFTNDYGVIFEPRKIVGFAKPEHTFYGRFVHIDSDCAWFPVKPESLEIIENES